jgi:CDP-diacylglycerol--serine O-phosphatidyltransferase
MYRFSNVVFLVMGLIYMFSGIWARAAYGWTRRRRRRPAGIAAPEAVDAEPDPLRPL